MSDSVLGANSRGENRRKRPSITRKPAQSQEPVVSFHSWGSDSLNFSRVDLDQARRLAVVVTPSGRGTLRRQVHELLGQLLACLNSQAQAMTVTLQTVFLRDAADLAECEGLFSAFYGDAMPVTNFVLQPPSGGAALAVEAWAIGGAGIKLERFGSQTLAVNHDGLRWVYCAGVGPGTATGAYAQTIDALYRIRACLACAKSGLEHVVRTWYYLGGITEPDPSARQAGTQRYQELNRARTDYYRDIQFRCTPPQHNLPNRVYPASTGIGMGGHALVVSCVALQTEREDVFFQPLENPQQTPAYAYHPRYSSQSPKFSRAMALVQGDYATTWISGTASIVHSESCHPGDLGKQVEQTLDNIERLIARENFAFHGVAGAGARLSDLAKVRVYLKRSEDLAACRELCERRLGSVPAIYATADICRPELLVEIEGVAFSRCSGGSKKAPGAPHPQ